MTPQDFRSQLAPLVHTAAEGLTFGEVVGPLLNAVASLSANSAVSNGLCPESTLEHVHDMLDDMYPAYVAAYAPREPGARVH